MQNKQTKNTMPSLLLLPPFSSDFLMSHVDPRWPISTPSTYLPGTEEALLQPSLVPGAGPGWGASCNQDRPRGGAHEANILAGK